MTFSYKPTGVCAMSIILDIENDIIKSVEFKGGCNGNTKGIANLCAGRKVDEIIKSLKGIKCGFKATSCPDQLALALLSYKETNSGN